MSEIKPLTLACLCRKVTIPLSVPSSYLPLRTHLCHCSYCRHIFGMLCVFHTVLPESCFPPDFSPISLGLTKYPATENGIKYFCETCGSHMIDYEPKDKQWWISTGVLDQKADETLLFAEHIFVGSSGDGGFADWLPSVSGKELPRWEARSGSALIPQDWRDPNYELLSLALAKRSDKLHAYCYCKGVQFDISRPDPEDKDTWWMSKDKRRWWASNCCCESCARESGNNLTHMAFVCADHITLPDGSPFRMPFGTMKTYHSSPGTQRTFCGTCGATVFYHADERPKMVAVAPGLFDASGARAEDWLAWLDGRVSWLEHARDPGLVHDLKNGLIAFGKRHPGIMEATEPAKEAEESG